MNKQTIEQILSLDKKEFEKYFNSCPVTYTQNIIGGKWKPIILSRIRMGINRFGIMQRSIPTISKQMLTAQLRELEDDGIVSRKVYAEVPPRVEYNITKSGQDIFPIIEAMAKWALNQRKFKS